MILWYTRQCFRYPCFASFCLRYILLSYRPRHSPITIITCSTHVGKVSQTDFPCDWTWYLTCQSLKTSFNSLAPGRNAWWRHQAETFSALLAICAGNSPVAREFPTQRPVTRSFDVFFDLRLNRRLSKQSWGLWIETLACPLWRHYNGLWLWKYTFRTGVTDCVHERFSWNAMWMPQNTFDE